jgi:N-acetylmuramic acid 6-phosphate etherase
MMRNRLLKIPAQSQARGASVTTEDSNPGTVDIDTLPTSLILRRINAEDATVAPAVERELPAIEAVVDRVVDAVRAGGRLIYVGAGTSGRLAVLDAAECPPTYNTDPRQVQALLAGAPVALTRSVEGAEDDEAQGSRDVDALGVDRRDVVLGIAASGRTPYVVGALRRARQRGACTAALVANPDGPVAATAELVIAPRTGPEVIAGSTRMKAGTAHKMVLNMISTAAMIRTGHTYGNLMVNLQATNSKLRERARRIVAQATGVDAQTAARSLAEADGQVKTAIVMLLSGVPAAEARERLARADGVVRRALQSG